MDFSEFVAGGSRAITEGAVLERVRRAPGLVLDPHILSGGFVYDAKARSRLAEIHSDYMRLARKARLPILAFTDTWRCSQCAIDASCFKGRPVNQDNVRFLNELRASLGKGSPIFIGGLVGPSDDAYKPEDALDRRSASDFHRPQILALTSAGIDFLYLATAPNVEEAMGVADAMAETDLPYVISFVIRRTGHVLDGIPIVQAMNRIDADAARPPVGFSINCVHAQVLETALETVAATRPEACRRILTFQANTADAEVEDLDNSEVLVTEPAEDFADRVTRLGRRFGLRILGGCCGTDGEHIEALASKLTGKETLA
ncbi:MAG: homocysteine S-methyltransferase family protein [Rhizobiales bacterium]|nr:homocysteine S-methyltransferase family protein [Hyphomicrobiales bacterium]